MYAREDTMPCPHGYRRLWPLWTLRYRAWNDDHMYWDDWVLAIITQSLREAPAFRHGEESKVAASAATAFVLRIAL